MKETALISGSSGFIGQHLINILRKRGIEVYRIPREFLSDIKKLTVWMQSVNPSYIFHLAAYGNHRQQQNETEIISANYLTTWHMLSASLDIPYKAFINVATSSMYGHKDHPMSEYDYLRPDTFYAASKAGAMYLSRAYAMQYNKPIVTAIPFSVFGEGEANFRFIPRVCKSLITGEKMSIAPAPTHDWIYAKDFVSALLFLTTSAETLKGEWVNIGMGDKFSNNAIINALISISERTLQYEEDYKEPENHSSVWVANNQKLLKLGWTPKYGVPEGLKRTWEYYKNKYEKKENI